MIETQRLILRPFLPQDAEALHAILSDAKTMAFWPQPFSAEQTQNWLMRSFTSYLESGFGRYAVILKAKNRLIGDCGLLRCQLADGTEHSEWVNDLGYIIHATEWGHRYGRETAQAVRDFAFQSLQLDCIHANMPHNHQASKRVAEALGLKLVRAFNNARNRQIRTLLYCMRMQEFAALQI